MNATTQPIPSTKIYADHAEQIFDALNRAVDHIDQRLPIKFGSPLHFALMEALGTARISVKDCRRKDSD